MCKEFGLTKKQKFYVIINLVIPICLGVFGLIFFYNFMPNEIFDKEELEEFNITYHSSPLMDIIVSDTEKGGYSLFGNYKGLQGGHKYDKCDYIFKGTCESDKNKKVFCPNSSGENPPELDKKTCVDFYEIKSFPYTKLKDRYYYADKKDQSFSYKDLLNSTIKKDEQCPKTKQNCGYLNEESKLCLSIEDKCPINDIIINNISTYSDGNITYKTVILGNDYIHYTNEKIDNQIIFNLLISIENPLSKIEIKESKYDNIFKLNEQETDIYYNGNIDNIIAYKNIYNTGITLKELFEYYDIFDTINKEPYYKTEYYNSSIYIFKKYPIPLNGITEEDENNMYNLYNKAFNYSKYSCFLLIASAACAFTFAIKSPNFLRIIMYTLLAIMHICICVFFCNNTDMLLNPGILKYYEDKDYHRFQLLLFNISFIIMCVIQNIWSVYVWIFEYIEGLNEDDNKNESFLKNESIINYNN